MYAARKYSCLMGKMYECPMHMKCGCLIPSAGIGINDDVRCEASGIGGLKSGARQVSIATNWEMSS